MPSCFSYRRIGLCEPAGRTYSQRQELLALAVRRPGAGKGGNQLQYETPVIRDFGSIAAHTFVTQKHTVGPGHVDEKAECSGGSGSTSYPTPCTGKGGPFDINP